MLKLRNYQTDFINNLRNAFKCGFKRVLGVLPCGAGKTISVAYMCVEHLKKRDNGYVWFLVHRQELIQQTIDTFNNNGIPTDNILIGMVQTISRHVDRYSQPSMIIIDECHHSTASQWLKIIDSYPTTPLIGLTATPCRLDGKPLGAIYEKLVIGVDSDYLLENGYLSQYDYYAPKTNIKDGDYKIKGSDYDMADVVDRFEKAKIYGDVLSKIDLTRKIIIYSPSVAYSRNLVQIINEHFKAVVAVHFDGDTPDKERKQIISDFKNGKIRILSNVDLIGEGFDVPDCDCVMLLRPTKSTALYIQQSMRCLRPAFNKHAIIYDFVGNVFRHGMPTDKREWSLSDVVKCKNPSSVPELLVRECKSCYLVYKGNARICPYCGHDNGKTKAQIEQEEQAELERIKAVERKKQRQEVGMCRDYDSLVMLAKKRGYKNPAYWAQTIINARHNKI